MSEPIRIDCYPARRLRARIAWAIAGLTLVPVLIVMALGTPEAALLLAFPLLFAPIALHAQRGCRTLRVSRADKLVSIDETHERFARGSILAVHTRSALGHVPFAPGPLDEHRFELAVWTSEAPSARAASFLKLAREIGEPLELERYIHARAALGEPDRALAAFWKPDSAFEAARAIAHALDVPWLHEGLTSIELRAGDTIDAPIVHRPQPLSALVDEHRRDFAQAVRAHARMTAEGLRLQWHVSRTADVVLQVIFALTVFAVAIFALFRHGVGASLFFFAFSAAMALIGAYRAADHGTYHALLSDSELIIEKGRARQRFARDELRDIEACASHAPSLWIATAQQALRLPVQTPLSALWLAEQLLARGRS